MMRKLLLFFAMLCVSVGTWATITTGSTTWCQYNSYADAENVLTIYVDDPGELATAIAGLDFTGVKILHISARNREASLLELSSEDIAALSSVNVETIEMMRAYVSPFTFTNSNLKRVILPYNWTRDEVKAFGEANSTSANFEACISTNDQDKYDNREGDVTLVAYLNKANTLKDAIMRTWNDTHGYAPLGNQVYQGGGDCSRLRELIVMGNFCARDISRIGNYDENGHYVINGVADENSTSYNKNTEGGNLYTAGDQVGALDGCNQIRVIDLKDGYVPDEYATDIVVGYCGIQVTNLREVWMPEDSRFKTVPADYLNINSKDIKQICIPGNIEYIKTRAFAGSGTTINYIWTTGPDATTKYDNGAYFVSGETTTLKYKVNPDPTDSENIDFADGDDNSFTYGTITLPPNLRLIERHAFASSVQVRDVYVLNETAPECHVDAFNSTLYHANNTVANDAIKEEDGVKIITRDAYTMSDYHMMAVLHYPRTTGTPQTQRYTDPSREYNIATGERDGNGNMLYFPTQTEFETAHAQGTYGYLWGAWNTERTWYNNEKTLGTAGGWYGDICGTDGHDTSNGQGQANQFYIDNPDEDPDFDKTKNTFYDVTMSDGNLPGGYTKPDGLMDYWNVDRRGIQLYPQAVSTTSNYVYVRDDNGDYVLEMTTTGSAGNFTNALQFREYAGSADDALERYSRKQVLQTDGEGNLVYEGCSDGEYVQNYEIVEDANGDLIHDIEVEENAEGNYVKDYAFTEDNENGTYYHPLTTTAAPADIWNTSSYNPTDYFWGAATYTQDNNGEWVKFWGETYRTAENVQSHEVEAFNTAAADPANHYSKTVTGYTQCTSAYDINQHSADLYKVGENYVLYVEGAADYVANVNDTKYSKSYSDTYRAYNESTDAGEKRYDVVDNGYVAAVSPADDDKQHYTKNYLGTYRRATSADANEPRYCTVGVDYVSDTEITYSKLNDYRGWHQFVLAATAHNSTIPFEPLRSFISDTDWWTICEPYDLKYSDLIKFFGYDRAGFDKKIPYLSKLMYVIRDVENQKITLMFSKNLMEYKEQMAAGEGIVHGTINEAEEEGKWTSEELAEDPVILHAGVPYLIRPNLVSESGSGFQRQFDIYKNQDPDLYARLKASQDISAGKQFQMVYNGEYTVPAYVVGYDAAGAVSENTVESKTIENKDGSSFTYTSGTIKYNGKNVSYKVSSDFTYTFVGTFYKSAMPQYCYFLGYDSAKKKAVFRYSHVLDMDGWNWNNETGIICPNFDTSLTIHQASSMNDPARWVFNPNNKTDNVNDYVKCDDFTVGSSGNAKSFTMDFGASNYNETTGISEMKVVPATKSTKVYTTNGVFVGTSVENLQKGVYIVNGKKYVVK